MYKVGVLYYNNGHSDRGPNVIQSHQNMYLMNNENAKCIYKMYYDQNIDPSDIAPDIQQYQISSVSVHHMYPLSLGGPSILSNYILVKEVEHAKIHTSSIYQKLVRNANQNTEDDYLSPLKKQFQPL